MYTSEGKPKVGSTGYGKGSSVEEVNSVSFVTTLVHVMMSCTNIDKHIFYTTQQCDDF